MILCAVWAVVAGNSGFDPIFQHVFKGSGSVVPVAIVVLLFIFMDKLFVRTSETTPTVKLGEKKAAR